MVISTFDIKHNFANHMDKKVTNHESESNSWKTKCIWVLWRAQKTQKHLRPLDDKSSNIQWQQNGYTRPEKQWKRSMHISNVHAFLMASIIIKVSCNGKPKGISRVNMQAWHMRSEQQRSRMLNTHGYVIQKCSWRPVPITMIHSHQLVVTHCRFPQPNQLTPDMWPVRTLGHWASWQVSVQSKHGSSAQL